MRPDQYIDAHIICIPVNLDGTEDRPRTIVSDRFTFETLKNRPEVEVFETVAFDVVERQRLRDNDTTGLYGVRVVAVVYSYNDRVCYAYG